MRESKRGGADSPYAISVVHSREIFHVLVRKRDDGKMAVGKPKFREKVVLWTSSQMFKINLNIVTF